MPTSPKNFNLAREIAERTDADWHFGAMSQPGIVSIPEAERDKYLPKGETQFDAFVDFTDCASRSPVNHLEALFTYHFHHDMKPENKQWLLDNHYVQNVANDSGETMLRVMFSDRYIAILSGTTHEGNSLKSPIETIRKQGLVPKALLPKEDWMHWEDYYDSSKITPAIKSLGTELINRFPINYDIVSLIHFGDALKDDMLGVAGFAWPMPVNGVYPANDGGFNHAFLLSKLPKWQAFDNYQDPIDNDFDKNLAPDYKFYEYGYRVYVSKENVPSALPLTISDQIAVLLAKIQALWTSITPAPALPSRADTLYNMAFSYIGRDASPNDEAPDETGCANSLSSVIQKALPELKFPMLLSTKAVYDYLIKSPSFKPVSAPTKGTIILSVTGTGNGALAHGHCGIVGRIKSGDGTLWVMSNDSKTGKWTVNYTIKTWKDYFEKKGGIPTLFINLT